jgi:hypothetical protein
VVEQCPACRGEGGKEDYHETVHCCGAPGDCGGPECTGPEAQSHVDWIPCGLCGGEKYVDRVTAVTYVLEA